ncbi:TBC1 domain, member 5 [Podochytrium sp. JEL0797]|nr:TBC1 domain, member 5 [Podochytrium sp. JEL0797]
MRSLYWKLFLEFLPNLNTDTWSVVLHKERSGYDQLKRKFVFDPAAEAEEADLATNNPLSLAEESPWTRHFQDSEIQKTIRQDVERTIPDHPFFRSPTVQETMLHILFIWCKLNPSISYRQGMHELLAPILFVVDADKRDPKNPTAKPSDPVAQQVFDPDFVEHDAFVLFDRVMRTAKQWFEVGQDSKEPYTKQKVVKGMFDDRKRGSMGDLSHVPPIVTLCMRVQNDLVQHLDYELYAHLNELQIEPQLYDANLGLVEWVCAGMLLLLRDQCVHADYVSVLQKLMKYPSLESLGIDSVPDFLQHVKSLKANYHRRSLENLQSLSPSVTSSNLLQTNKVKSPTNMRPVPQIPLPNTALTATADSNNLQRVTQKLTALKTRDAHLSKKLTHCMTLVSSLLNDFDSVSDRRNELEGVLDELAVVQSELEFSAGTSMSIETSRDSLEIHERDAKYAAAQLHAVPKHKDHKTGRIPAAVAPVNPLDAWMSSLSSAAQEVQLSKTVQVASDFMSGLFEDKSTLVSGFVNPFSAVGSSSGRSEPRRQAGEESVESSPAAQRLSGSRYPPDHWRNNSNQRETQ